MQISNHTQVFRPFSGEKPIPYALTRNILSCITFPTVLLTASVSKNWNKIVTNFKFLKEGVYRDYAVGLRRLLEQSFTTPIASMDEEIEKIKDQEFDLLPDNIVSILKSPCPAYPDYTVMQTHVLFLDSGIKKVEEGLIHSKLVRDLRTGQLLDSPKDIVTAKNCPFQFDFGFSSETNFPIWKLMMRLPVPNSLEKSYEKEQQNIIEEYYSKSTRSFYRMPTILELVTGAFAYTVLNTRKSNDKFLTHHLIRTDSLTRKSTFIPGMKIDCWTIAYLHKTHKYTDVGIVGILNLTAFRPFTGERPIPRVFTSKILSYLGFPKILSVARVCTIWNKVVTHIGFIRGVIYYQHGFGTHHLCQAMRVPPICEYFFKDKIEKEIALLPPDIVTVLKQPCYKYKNKMLMETHDLILVTNAIFELGFFKQQRNSVESFIFDIDADVPDYRTPITWKLILKGNILDGRGMTFSEQANIIQNMTFEINKKYQKLGLQFNLPSCQDICFSILSNFLKKRSLPLFTSTFTVQDGTIDNREPQRVMLDPLTSRWKIERADFTDENIGVSLVTTLSNEKDDMDE